MSYFGDQPSTMSPPMARVTYNFGVAGHWEWAELTVRGNRVSLHADNGKMIEFLIQDIVKVTLGVPAIAVYLTETQTAGRSKPLNLMFTDGNSFFSNARKGSLYGGVQNRKLEQGAMTGPEFLAWTAFFKRVSPRSRNLRFVLPNPWIVLAASIGVVVIIILATHM
jgi:hypothetical protein